ncbi:MAG: four helix bundle suffix domain-containing protein [Tidjanibacter sp.]|nr:four helix bundle suffix domain-containing protein [Tidjanibacter sp.]
MTAHSNFIRQQGNYKELLCYQKSVCVYDVTYYFANKFFSRGDRTIDQMVQAARSCKQNIAEGCAASTTSKETEIKLINVARASLCELLEDYEDYLRVRKLELWTENDVRYQQARKVCAKHNDSLFYTVAIEKRSDETIANIAIILIHQTDTLLKGLFNRAKANFLENGGIKEEMLRERLAYRKSH